MKTNKTFITIVAIAILFVIGCKKDDEEDISPEGMDYKQEMRDFVISISEYAKAENSGFVIIPQNGIEIVTNDGEENGSVNSSYLNAIDGHGQEDLFYGYDNDDEATPSGDNTYLRTFLDKSKNAGNTILVTDYCYTQSKMVDSYSRNNTAGYISFAADERELNNIPDHPTTIYGENSNVITSLSQVKNFLYLINPELSPTKADAIYAITSTNYDLLIMDLFFHDDTEFTASEINQLKNKANGGKRMVVSYMSIGEAEDYRYYWNTSWETESPVWLDSENPEWEGNYKVKYWEQGWQDIILGEQDSYLQKILDAGFDGVYLDIIEAFEHFE
ncbi:MAG: hypothetical protein GY756_13050 [bacterium]|nr:hypothetical protein [bacterium]